VGGKEPVQSKESLLFYVKFPEKGNVKTRLAKDIGEQHTVELYKCFVLDILAMLAETPQTVCICYAPEDAEQRFRAWLGDAYLYMAQQGDDLGERMNNSFQEALQHGFEKVVIIGSDLPDLPSQYIVKAFEKLRTFESVIGPSDDGGYYLLGFRNDTFFPEVFQDIIWSHPLVYTETLKKLEKRGVNFFRLPEWNDIDNLDELQQWYKRNRSENTRAIRTMTYIKNMKIMYALEAS
jgi:rSAM/selenodomain-associated transferase 1